jgi:hypothetical protein
MGFSFMGCVLMVPVILIGTMIVVALAAILPVTLPLIIPIGIGICLSRTFSRPIRK